MNGYHKDHDEKCVDIVEEIANLGGFQVEFPVYLTCYADDGKVFFYVAEEKKNAYNFCEEKLKENIYCLIPSRKVKKSLVAAGKREELYEEYKVAAAKEYLEEGAARIAEEIVQYAPAMSNEAQKALELFGKKMKVIDNKELQQLYKGMLDMAYFSKKINGVFYSKAMERLKIETRYMEDAPVLQAVHEREFSGFAYYDENMNVGYYTNAVYEAALSRREELMIKGYIVSPIIKKICYFNDISKIGEFSSMFRNELKQIINGNMMKFIKRVLYDNSNLNLALYQAIDQAEKDNNKLKTMNLKYYKSFWGY